MLLKLLLFIENWNS